MENNAEELKIEKGANMIVCKPVNYNQINKIIWKYLSGHLSGIYVTLNKAHPSLIQELKNNKIDTSKLYFIDSVCKKIAKNKREYSNCVDIEGVESLTELSLAISSASHTGKFKFLIFDSITTLLIYHDQETAEKFISYLINKLKSLDISVILISIDEDKSNKIVNFISQFADKTINL